MAGSQPRATQVGELPVPDFYDPAHAGQWNYAADEQSIMERAISWRERYGIRPSSEDPVRIHLFLVDLQKDFCMPEGALFVGGRGGRGAVEDSDRIVRFIYRNMGIITEITCTLDTHLPHQIFFPSFWLDVDGRPPEPHQEVTTADVAEGRFRPNPAIVGWLALDDYDWLLNQVEFYCKELERQGKHTLYLWPFHCLLGSGGYSMVGVVQEARLFHSFARGAENWAELKGSTPLTECYSVLGPEVQITFDGEPLGEKNDEMVETLAGCDAVIIAGQAASHCVRFTVEDLLAQADADLASKVYLMRDCMSPVAVPDPDRPGDFLFDFTVETEEAIKRFAEAGVHIVESTTPIAEWPGISLQR